MNAPTDNAAHSPARDNTDKIFVPFPFLPVQPDFTAVPSAPGLVGIFMHEWVLLCYPVLVGQILS